MPFVRFCLLAVIVGWSWQPCSGAADPLDEARALLEYAQHREDLVLEGVQWRWLLEKGKCRSIDDALKGVFDDKHPVDRYVGRWLSNDGVYLYESIAQQERRKIGEDAEQQVVFTTDGSEIFLSTENSRLEFDPEPFAGWNGQVQTRARGLMTRWGPSSIPVHGGRFGMGRISAAIDRVGNPDNKVVLENGVTITGLQSKVARIRTKDGFEAVYYFGDDGLALLQLDHLYDGVLSSQMVVIETKVVSAGDEEIELPAKAASFHKHPGEELWSVSRITTTELKLEPAQLSNMVVRTENAVFVLYPLGRRQSADFVSEISAENLDEVVDTLFRNFEREEAARLKGRMIRESPLTAERARLRWIRWKYLLALNLSIALIIVLICVYRRRFKNG